MTLFTNVVKLCSSALYWTFVRINLVNKLTYYYYFLLKLHRHFKLVYMKKRTKNTEQVAHKPLENRRLPRRSRAKIPLIGNMLVSIFDNI